MVLKTATASKFKTNNNFYVHSQLSFTLLDRIVKHALQVFGRRSINCVQKLFIQSILKCVIQHNKVIHLLAAVYDDGAQKIKKKLVIIGVQDTCATPYKIYAHTHPHAEKEKNSKSGSLIHKTKQPTIQCVYCFIYSYCTYQNVYLHKGLNKSDKSVLIVAALVFVNKIIAITK